MYSCLNVVCGPVGSASAVLIRAVAPLTGEDVMRAARAAHDLARRRATRTATTGPAADFALARIGRLPATRLASGPGLVGAAFSIDRHLDGIDLCDPASPLRLEAGERGRPARPARIVATARIGIGYAGEPWVSAPYRLFLADEPAVSGPRLRGAAVRG